MKADSPSVRVARLAAARAALLVQQLAGDVRRKLLDGSADRDGLAASRDGSTPAGHALDGSRPGAHGTGYARHWLPPDQRTARIAIYNSDDEAGFEEGGRRDADRVALHVSPTSVVLDFGCGSGRVARYVAPLCAELWAVDVSPRMLELAAERLAPSANVRYARCHDVTIPDVASASVDVVYSLLVLQHLEREDAFLALRELRRVIRPTGVAVLTFPNLLADGYLEGFVRYALTGEVANHARARVYTPQEVERLLPAAGFSVVDIEPGDDIIATCKPAT